MIITIKTRKIIDLVGLQLRDTHFDIAKNKDEANIYRNTVSVKRLSENVLKPLPNLVKTLLWKE